MGNDANAFINKNAIDQNLVYLYGINNSNALHFYGKHIFVNLSSTKAFESNQIILTEKDSTQFFKTIFPSSKVIHEGNQYPVSVLTGSFLDPSTRMKEMPRYVMIDLDGKP